MSAFSKRKCDIKEEQDLKSTQGKGKNMEV